VKKNGKVLRRWTVPLLLLASADPAWAAGLLESAFDNVLYPDTNGVPAQAVPRSMTPVGNGMQSATELTNALWQSVVTLPIGAMRSNVDLGDEIPPPPDADLDVEPFVDYLGGNGQTVWLDYAQTLIASDAGPVQVTWTLEGGRTQQMIYVVSSNPNKRPVRLYWTEGQNSGPVITFAQNYRVDLYYNSQITSNHVWIADNKLRAATGAEGKLLLTYSRLDETSGRRELLAYEIVNVLEPMTSRQSVEMGAQLFPLTRSFDTEDLFAEITRGALDPSGQGEIYVYQHQQGPQKGRVWAIRETRGEAWKIEVFWKAKEELDVLWPFEVDIYDVEWGKDLQLYVRGDTDAGDHEPKVLFPPEMVVEAMDYQTPDGHAVVGQGTFHTTVDEGKCLLKYSVGDEIWFEPVKSVSCLSTNFSRVPRGWDIADELRPAAEGTHGTWPGYLYVPFGEGYNAGYYDYPAVYPDLDTHESSVFPVNEGRLEVWWANASRQENLPFDVYFPSEVACYDCTWPADAYEIVIAGGEGSEGLSPGTGERSAFDFSDWNGVHIGRQGDGERLPFSPAEGMTLEFWYRPVYSNYPAVGDVGVRFAGAQAVGDTNVLWYMKESPTNISGNHEFGFTSRNGDSGYWRKHQLEDLEWRHIAVTWKEGRHFRIFQNGDKTYHEKKDWPEEGIDFVWVGLTSGQFDDIRLWKGVRSDNEIRRYRYAPVDPADPSLLCWLDGSLAQEGGLPVKPHDAAFFGLPSEFWKVNGYPTNNALEARFQAMQGYYFDEWDEYSGTYAPETFGPGLSLQGLSPSIYNQPDPGLPGYNPNEEHALVIQDVAYALRNDLNTTSGSGYTSDPYVLVEYANPTDNRLDMVAFKVVAENSMYPFKKYQDAGQMIQPPPPISLMQPLCAENSQVSGPEYRDRKGAYWAMRGGHGGGTCNYAFDYYYPSQSGFWYPEGDEIALLEPVPWMEQSDGSPKEYHYVVSWPDDCPELLVGQTLLNAINGLPAIRGQLSVDVAYQQSQANTGTNSVMLLDPTVARRTALAEVPAGMKTYRDPATGYTFFSDLPDALRSRLCWNPSALGEELQLAGEYVERTDEHDYLLLNTLVGDSRAACTNEELVAGIEGAAGDDWRAAIESLPTDVVELASDTAPFDSLALAAPGTGEGYVTLVFNNSTNEAMVDPSENISMEIIRVADDLYTGRIDPIYPRNPLDRKLTFKYTADYGGEQDLYEFKWEYADPINGAAPSDEDEGAWADHTLAAGRDSLVIGDTGIFGLSDHYLRCRYRALDSVVQALVGTNWNAWTPPVLAEGWIKRALKAINPYDQRIQDYMNVAISTDLSMVQQAGAPYNGNVPLNYYALNDYGLIPLYQTLIDQVRGLSIDAGTVAGNDLSLALQMAAGRLADLYMVLGNEAYADALNPTVDLGGDSGEPNYDASSVFCFQNQLPDLLSEELALLRGRDDSMNPPVDEYPLFNRLAWNFTADIAGGEVAYALNYGISDLKGDLDGTVDVDDAKILYPQGHGDAYGHYLSALKNYYSLLRHPNFTWLPQVEGVLAGDTEITVSYLHEKKLVQAAARKAQAAAEVAARTYRQDYDESAPHPCLELADANTNRAWGVAGWAGRAGMGAYFDWLAANSLLPPVETDPEITGIRVIDRQSIPELGELVQTAGEAQQQMDRADTGLNPLGLARGTVPFDISAEGIDLGRTHFEQILERAKGALKNAAAVFDRVKQSSRLLRDQNEAREFDAMVADEEAAFNRGLVEIYGYPYADDIGPGKLYPQGYNGPDLAHYMYVEDVDIDGTVVPESGQDVVFTWTNSLLSVRSYSDTVHKYKVYGFYGTGTLNYQGMYASNTVQSLSVHVGPNGVPIKPDSYSGVRRAEGEIQIAIGEYLAALQDASRLANRISVHSADLKDEADALRTAIYNKADAYDDTIDAEQSVRRRRVAIRVLQTLSEIASRATDMNRTLSQSVVESFPKVVGLSNDPFAPSRFVAMLQSTVSYGISMIIEAGYRITEASLLAEIHEIQVILELKLLEYELENLNEAGLADINQMARQQQTLLDELQVGLQNLENARMRLKAVVAEGDRLQVEREGLRINWASDLSVKRYRNMAHQIMRNDDLARYNESFENAARYCYLAAKAYDYETGLLASDASNTAGRDFISQVVKARSLGRFTRGAGGMPDEPLPGGDAGDPGLADILARMEANWDVLKGRLGFNNPQSETGRFSLRTELFRIAPSASSDGRWRKKLESFRVRNLLDVPEFRRTCLPFDPAQAREPALVIPFSTTIAMAKNYFGRDLAAGDNAYDSTHFATKIRSAGVWFEHYRNEYATGLANQPRVYLVPAGVDRMRVPSADNTQVRSWSVVDQALPVPYPVNDADWGIPDWSVLKDMLGDEMYNIRRYPSMRAYHDSGGFTEAEVISNSRLVGRSVWNTRWLLMIPGRTLLSDADEGLERFIHGQGAVGGERDGNGVRDIKIYFQTYSYSGN